MENKMKCYDCLDEYETELVNHNGKTFCKDCLEWRLLAKDIKSIINKPRRIK